ncbi:MAG: helix-turn-helix domain-containing protein [Bacillota bacterium]
MELLSSKVIKSINDVMPEEPESYYNSDLVVFKPRFFVGGVSQFNYYHFVIPRVEIPSFNVDNKVINLHKNMIFPTNPGQRLFVSPTTLKQNDFKDIKFIAMFFEKQKLQELTKEEFNKTDFSFCNKLYCLSNNLSSLISKFETEFRVKQLGYHFILDCLSTELAINLLRELKCNIHGGDGFRRYTARKDINIAIDYLWENDNSEFSLDKLCRIVNLSPYYFMRLFKDNTGKTPYDYYMDIKINKAKQYLKAGKHSITEICFILGFSSHSHFSSIFKRKVGLTPSEFIKSIQ